MKAALDLTEVPRELFQTRNALEAFHAGLSGVMDREHNGDGTHAFTTGTWVPVIGGVSGTTGQTYSVQIGEWIKAGGFVLAYFRVVLTAKGTITGNVEIQGLPFTVSHAGRAPIGWENLATNWVNLMASFTINTLTASVLGAAAAGTNNTAHLVTADIGNTSELAGSLMYRTAA